METHYSHLGDQINAATRLVHTQLNSQIIRRLPLALPPAANTPSTYVSGLLHVAPVYITFETLWYMILLSHKEQTKEFRNPSPYQNRPSSPQPPQEKDRFLLDPKTSHRVPFHDGDDAGLSQRPGTSERIFSILESLRIPGLMRVDCLRADIGCLTGWSKEMVDEQIEVAARNGNLKKFVTHIKQSVGESPPVLLAYAWVLYMALFSGGRILRSSLEKAGPEFWKTRCDPIMPSGKACAYPDKSHATAPMSQRLRFFHFNTNQDGEDLKREFKRRLVEAEDLLTTSERARIVHESVYVFEHMLALVSQLDHVFLEGTKDVSVLDVNVTRADADADTPSPSPSPGPSFLKPAEFGGRVRDSIVLSKERGVRTVPGMRNHRRSRYVSIDEPFDERGDRSDAPSPYLVASLLRPMEQGGRLRDSIAVSRERGLRTTHLSSHNHSESTSIDENSESQTLPQNPEIKLINTHCTSELSSPSGPGSLGEPLNSSMDAQGTLAGAQPSSSSETASLLIRGKTVRFKKPSAVGSSKRTAEPKDSEGCRELEEEAEHRPKSSAEKVSPTSDNNSATGGDAPSLPTVPIHIAGVDGSDADDSSDSDKQMKQLQKQQQRTEVAAADRNFGQHGTISVTITDTAMMEREESNSSSDDRQLAAAASGEESYRAKSGTGISTAEDTGGGDNRPSLKRSSSSSSSRHNIKSWFSSHITKVEKKIEGTGAGGGGASNEVVVTETVTEAASTSTSSSALSLKAKMKNKLAHGQDKLKVKMDHAEEKLKRGKEKLKEKSKELSLLAIGPVRFMWKFVFVLGVIGAVWGVGSMRSMFGWTFMPVTMVVKAAGWVGGGLKGAFAGGAGGNV
ncbi:uncharacterized protein B0T23DRAFT_329151 [Neurospora hispaniola]|uniref:Heme oxygenase-like protein n=1 Tax=Neurospora hispaniola TaxID=588809 RepID=A0AAJ0IF79_9PEZI|nr:hypothetical protein B0T23DRAFT_329151 [Neurospora hispaniola]